MAGADLVDVLRSECGGRRPGPVGLLGKRHTVETHDSGVFSLGHNGPRTRLVDRKSGTETSIDNSRSNRGLSIKVKAVWSTDSTSATSAYC